ncbi:hypothetical protein CN128_09065 [Sinorhizobium meliloti]|nr:hypothetical protein [Sinorhizobium meliloti]MDX0014473.1 hypothetical protein [Sinorhizobium meliloti]MDX0306817.1 hypothetical protein [Sinorhizobium meliloti]RVI36213.1 hypothetical protein CN202_03180 [Sinorhizobium meliloti]RVM58543.1 hypothetical protein CN128_09065 [Sinorhizobium meliloti]
MLEVAVHKGFRALDMVAHTMTAAAIADAGDVYVVDPKSVPNPNWARPGIPGAGQQAYGDDLRDAIGSSQSRARSRRIAGTWSFSGAPRRPPMPSNSKSHLRWTRDCIHREHERPHWPTLS